MSLRSWAPGKLVQQPRGAWMSLTNRKAGVPSRASNMQNMRIRYGTARTRPGTSAVFNSAGAVTGMFNWITPQGTNLVLYQDGTSIKDYNQSLAISSSLFSVPGSTQAPSFAPLDVWAYLCGFDSSGNGTFQAKIYDGSNVDKAFRPAPVITGWTAVDGGTGQCTQGQHFIGFCYQNRTGYTGIPVTGITYAITATTNVSFPVAGTTNATPDVITVTGHTFVNGDKVTGMGSVGDTAINGVFLVTSVSGDTLELTDLLGNPINGNGAYTGGGSLTSPDLITSPGNNLQVGQQVTIASATGDAAINGIRIVDSTPTAGSTFTVTDTDGNLINSSGAYIGGGTVTNPIQFTTQAGLRSISVSVTIPAMPDGGMSANGGVQATLFMIATAANNPNIWYFMPTDSQTGQIGEQPVPLSTPVTLDFVMSLSDFDINDSLSGDTAQANFLFLAQDAAGNGPFNPNFVVAYGQRMCYGIGTVLYVSEINNPQQISADTNQIIMQNQRSIGYAFPLPGNQNLYLTGLGWTGYVTDNSDSPSTWSVPVIVSDKLGTQFPNCVCSETGGPWVWVVTPGGAYLFDGAYENQPLTYLCSGLNEQEEPIGWSRVNWKAAYNIKIVDDVDFFKLYIAVPLDGSTECNYMFCIDYRMGKTYDTCDISLDVFNPQLFGSIAIVREYATGQNNLWIGPAAAGNVARQDVTVHNDQGNAIHGIWTSGLAKGNQITSSMVRVGSLDIWARGNAPLDISGMPTFLVTLFGPDGNKSFPVIVCTTQGVPAALTETPGLTYIGKCDLSMINDWYAQFETNAVDAWSEISGFVGYQRPDLYNR